MNTYSSLYRLGFMWEISPKSAPWDLPQHHHHPVNSLKILCYFIPAINNCNFSPVACLYMMWRLRRCSFRISMKEMVNGLKILFFSSPSNSPPWTFDSPYEIMLHYNVPNTISILASQIGNSYSPFCRHISSREKNHHLYQQILSGKWCGCGTIITLKLNEVDELLL